MGQWCVSQSQQMVLGLLDIFERNIGILMHQDPGIFPKQNDSTNKNDEGQKSKNDQILLGFKIVHLHFFE